MSFTVVNVPQRSPEWHDARLGRLTGSRAGDMLSKIKSGEAAARRDYRVELVCERLTGLPADQGFVSKEMQRGTDLEPAAFARYEAVTGQMVRRTGFLRHDALMAGCSLDGDVNGLEGIVELKCPKSATHLKYIRTGCLPPDHEAQIRHNVWISGASWADFCSFDDRFPLELQLFRVRVSREACRIDLYAPLALQFLEEVDRETDEVRALGQRAA